MSKVAIITGSGGGIGDALVKTYLNDRFYVIGLDKKPSTIKKPNFTFIKTDLFIFSQQTTYRKKIIKEIKEKFPNKLTKLVLINNAALQILNPVEKISWDNWLSSITVNTISPFFLVQSFLKELKLTNGHVVNISSVHAKVTKPNFLTYAASKAALESITKSLSIELSRFGISINGIAPAAISTEMLLAGFKNKPEQYKKLNECHPSKSIGSPSDVSNLAKLITDNNNRFMTGSIIDLDGGISSLLVDPDNG
jgi:NAD(P)-dependent dehydrogenase (short-subunit alcohol dehydrogenase family)